MNEQVPSKELPATLRASVYDGELWIKVVDVQLLLKERAELRTALTGIQSCSTCEACRGAATLALGGSRHPNDCGCRLDDETLLSIARQWDQGPGETFEFDTPTLLRFMRHFAATVEGMVRDGATPEPGDG